MHITVPRTNRNLPRGLEAFNVFGDGCLKVGRLVGMEAFQFCKLTKRTPNKLQLNLNLVINSLHQSSDLGTYAIPFTLW